MYRGTSIGNTTIGAILVALGVLFLFTQLLGVNIWSVSWPFLIIGVGMLFFIAMLVVGRSAGGLAIPGTILTMVGLILLYQNSSDRWESWSYAWTLIVVAAGIGIYIKGIWEDREKDQRTGMRVAGLGLLLFLLFGAFFELGSGGLGFGRASGVLLAGLLIAAGIYLILRSRREVPVDTPSEAVTEEKPSSRPSSDPV